MKTSSAPKVSVIIPVYNVEKYLRQCLDSVVNQTLKEIEIICIDDGSTDSSLEILKEYAQKDNRIIVINKNNEGVSIARNIGINTSKGKFISFIDSDDYIEKNTLELSYNKLEEENSDIVIFGTNDINEYNKKQEHWNTNLLNNFYSKKYQITNFSYFIGLLCNTWDKMYRKSFLLKENITFPSTVTIAEDNIFCIDSYLHNAKYSFISSPLYNYRTHRNNSLTTSNPQIIRQHQYAFNIFEKYDIFQKQNKDTQKIIINKFLNGCYHFLKNSPKKSRKHHLKHLIFFIKQLIKTYEKKNIKTLESYKKIKHDFFFIDNLFRKIFHIENTKDKKRKIITLLFIKIKIKRKYNTDKYFNNINPKSVLLFEAHPHHGECLPAYIKYFNDLGFHVDILLLKDLIKNRPFCRMPKNANYRILECYYQNREEILTNKKILNYKHIVITTAIYNYNPQISVIEQYPIFKQHPSVYIIEHDINDISKNKEEDYLSTNRLITLWNFSKGIMLNPHYFGNIKTTNKSHKTTFIVVGNIEAKRKNHKLLFDSIEKLHNKNKDFNVIIIGRNKDNNYQIKDSIKQHLTITGYLDFPNMFNYMEQADFFIPLLDYNNPEHNRYLTSGVSGSIQLILGFKKLPIIQQKFADFYGFNQTNGIIYKEDLTQAMEIGIELNQTQYKEKQLNLKSYADEIYKKSQENLKFMLENAQKI